MRRWTPVIPEIYLKIKRRGSGFYDVIYISKEAIQYSSSLKEREKEFEIFFHPRFHN